MAYLAYLLKIPYDNKPERLYLCTDTHATGLLFGAFLAACYRHRPSRFPHHPLASKLRSTLGITALIYLIICFFFLKDSSQFLYRGGFASVSLATIFLILATSQHGSLLNLLFHSPIMEWIGKRSYNLYLWHWPVFVYFRAGEELPDNIAASFLIRLGLTLLLSEATYQFIEQPIRTSKTQAFNSFSTKLHATIVSVAFIAGLGLLYFHEGGTVQPQLTAIRSESPEQINVQQVVVTAMTASEAIPTSTLAMSSVILSPTTSDLISSEAASNLDLTDTKIFALGDSVMLGARPVLIRKLPIISFDAVVGRQGSDLLKLVKRLGGENKLTNTILIHIGTNGYIYEQNLEQILQILHSAKRIVFINVHASRRWSDDNNDLLRKEYNKNKKITLVDWHAAAEGHPEYFVKDGIHLTLKGMGAYAELVRVTLGLPNIADGTQLRLEQPMPRKRVTSTPVVHDVSTTSTNNPPLLTEKNNPPTDESVIAEKDSS